MARPEEPVLQRPSMPPQPEKTEGSNAGLVAAIVGVLIVLGVSVAFWLWRR
ncbi:MAG: hypothetical protein NZ930_05255 [Candidatus Bipolaricaulota bacterium]|nr:hypothetical protein [Candidatus Bipolaricaulota bacterium]MDW8030434.1 hypothetical protein [Candidatus Bipolaricaulota bacterium]